MKWAVIVRLNSGIEVARYEFNSEAAREMESAIRNVVRVIMDDVGLLRPEEIRIDVEAAHGRS